MTHKVLKAFAYSEDGVRSQQAAEGETVTVPAHLVPGLVAEGYLAEAGLETKVIDGAPETGAVEASAPAKRARKPKSAE